MIDLRRLSSTITVSILATAGALFLYHQFPNEKQRWLPGGIESGIQPVRVQITENDQRLAPLERAVSQDSSSSQSKTTANDAGTHSDPGHENSGNVSIDVPAAQAAFKLNIVLPDSTAAQQGLKSGDEILFYDGIQVIDQTDIQTVNESGLSGDKIELEILRDGHPMILMVHRGVQLVL